MVYAYDLWAQMPTKDLYDSQMMLAAIQVAKDMYDKGELAIKDFEKEYGDFYSPVLSDMDWYRDNVLNKVRNTIDYLYANGIDPVRSVEGRLAVRKAINDIDVGRIARNKVSAKNAEEYIKNRDALKKAGMWNPEYERQQLGGQLLEEWDGSLGEWSSTSPSPYLDYEQKYGHLFDKMGYEYDPEASKEHPGFLVSTKNKSRMHNILSANKPDLINDPQYQYDLNRMKNIVRAEQPLLPENAVDMEALRRLDNEIVERNYKGGMQMQEDPVEKRRREYINNLNLKAVEHQYRMLEKQQSQNNNGGGDSLKESISDAQYQLMRGTANIIKNTMLGRAAGISSYKDFTPDNFNFILAGAQEEIANKYYTSSISGGGDVDVSKRKSNTILGFDKNGKLTSNPNYGKLNLGDFSVTVSPMSQISTEDQRNNLIGANLNFINEISVDYSPRKFAVWVNKPTDSNDNTMSVISNDDDALSRLYDINECALNSYGTNRPNSDLNWAKGETNSLRNKLGKVEHLCMKSVGKMLTPVTKDGSVHAYLIVNLYEAKPGKNNQKTKYTLIGKAVYDMGITTYSNPNFGINGNTDTNLFFDENVDADVRWTGDQSVLHWEHVGAPNIDSTIAYPALP